MPPIFAGPDVTDAIPIRFVTAKTWPEVRDSLDPAARAYAEACGFEPKAGRHLLLPGDAGLAGVLFAMDADTKQGRDRFSAGRLPALLPAGVYRLVDAGEDAPLASLAFALGAYQFSRYRKSDAKNVTLKIPEGIDGDDLSRIVEAVTLARDLINTPTNDMGPSHLEQAARDLAARHGAAATSIVGDELLKPAADIDPCGRALRDQCATAHRPDMG